MILKLTAENFEQEIQKASDPILVDFWASWCGPCRALAPVLEELDKQQIIRIGKINVDESPELASRYHIMNIPCMILFGGGQEIDKIIGLQDFDDLREWIAAHK